jgi:hypothetical protein
MIYFSRHSKKFGNRLGYWWGFLLCFCLQPALAVEDLHFQMKQMTGKEWSLSDLSVDINLLDDRSASVNAGIKVLMFGKNRIAGIQLQCPRALISEGSAMSCSQGSMDIASSLLGKLKSTLTWQYASADQWQLQFPKISFSQGNLSLKLKANGGRIVVIFRLRGLAADKFKAFFPEGWDFSGRLNAQGEVIVKKMLLSRVNASAEVVDFSYTNNDGLQVGEEVLAQMTVDVRKKQGSWQGNAFLKIRQGQLYSDPFFIEVQKKEPVSINLTGSMDVDRQFLQIKSVELSAGSRLSARGGMQFDLQAMQIRNLGLSYSATDMSWLYMTIVQPLLIGTAMDDMTVVGKAQGELQITQGVLDSLSLSLQNLGVEQNAGLFGVSEIEADLYWQRSGGVKTSHISWRKGHVYKIGFQELNAAFDATAGKISLRPLSLPLLGGKLKLDKLDVDGLLDGNSAWQTQATLESLKLEELSTALGWPLLTGSLQAKIPGLYFEDSRLRMDGELRVKVFGGEVVVEGLQLEDALGVAPALETSVRLDNLDLEQITQVLDFGRIEGSLEGYIRNLRMVAWDVTGFDANLQSPAKDKRKHRISQRAIDNLTELGNGVSANLSATMLGIFDDFAYKQLALRVRLRGAVAELNGVPAPQGGYYIVQGARLPRIDVIGRNHQVAWKDLLSRVRDIRFDDMIVE